MSELPAGWGLASIERIARINPPRDASCPADRLVSFVPMASVEAESGRIDSTATRPFGELASKSYRPFMDGDVLFAKITPCMENGKAAVARNLQGRLGFGSTEFHVLRPEKGINADYLLFYLLQRKFRADAAKSMTGTAGQLRVPAKYLGECPIPIPPTAEQERIVAVIEEQFSRLDAGLRALQRARGNLKRMRWAALKTAVAGALGSGCQTPRSGLELPAGWSWQPLQAIIKRLRNGVFVSRPGIEITERPILRISAVRPMALDLEDVRYVPPTAKVDPDGSFLLEPGDLLFTRYSGNPEYVGACARVPAQAPRLLYPDKLIRVQVDRALVDPGFIEIAANVGETRRVIRSRVKTTAGQTGISGSDLKSVPFPVPPLVVQRQIVDDVDAVLAPIKGLEEQLDATARRSSSLRAAILLSAFSGKLASQDFGDDPVSALLEGIAADRASLNGRDKPAKVSGRRPKKAAA